MTAPIAPAIIGLGLATPAASASQQAAARFVVQVAGLSGDAARFTEAIYLRSGIAARASVLLHPTSPPDGPLDQSFFKQRDGPDDHGPTTAARMRAYTSLAVPLAVSSATAALRDAAPFLGDNAATQITHLILVSCTGFSAPGLDVALIDALGLSPSVRRLSIGFMGCHGGVVGLRTAGDLALAAGPDARVLLVCVELCSLHMQYSERPDQIVANALFADGAAAAIIVHDPRLHHKGLTTASGVRPLLLRSAASTLIPHTHGVMGWEIGDHGFSMTLAESIPGVIRTNLEPWMTNWLGSCGTSLAAARSAASWAVHPGGPRVLSAVQEALGLDARSLECSRRVLRDHGNMSSPTVMFILEQLTRSSPQRPELPPPPAPIIMLGFGPGLTAEALLLEPASR